MRCLGASARTRSLPPTAFTGIFRRQYCVPGSIRSSDLPLLSIERGSKIQACEVGVKITWMFEAGLVIAAIGVFGSVGSDAAVAAQEVKSQWNGAFTVEQAHRGEALYSDKCS